MKFNLIILFVLWARLIDAQQVEGLIVGRSLEDIEEAQPPIYLGEPPSNEGTNLLVDNDGSIKFIYRKGDWDHGGFSNELFEMRQISKSI